MPAEGTWEWDAKKTHAIAVEGSKESALLHALQTLGVDGVGPGLVSKMIEGGIKDMKALWQASEKTLAIIGPGRAATVRSSLRSCRERASMSVLLVASNLLPRGVGAKKLQALFAIENDPAKWRMTSAPGWTPATLAELLTALPAALDWIERSFPGSAVEEKPMPTAQASKFVVFTGVRDKELEAKILQNGWAIQDSVNSKTTVVVTDENPKESAKVKKARELGKEILRLSDFRKRC
jgi:NAD-dependent DNA ligase